MVLFGLLKSRQARRQRDVPRDEAPDRREGAEAVRQIPPATGAATATSNCRPAAKRSTRALLARMRHDGCGGIAGNAQLLTGIESASRRPVRKIVLITNRATPIGRC